MENTETVLETAETIQNAVVADPLSVEILLQNILEALNYIQAILYVFLFVIVVYLMFKIYWQVFRGL